VNTWADGRHWGRLGQGMCLGCRAMRLPTSASCSSLSYCNPFNIPPIQPRLTKSNLFLFFSHDEPPSFAKLGEILPMPFPLVLFQGLSAADTLQEMTRRIIITPATATSQAMTAPCTLTRITGGP
jgi:hypothetical protein